MFLAIDEILSMTEETVSEELPPLSLCVNCLYHIILQCALNNIYIYIYFEYYSPFVFS